MARPEGMTEWIERLRSGTYPQGRGFLAQKYLDYEGNPTGKFHYCCLGVRAAQGGFLRVGSGDERYYGVITETGFVNVSVPDDITLASWGLNEIQSNTLIDMNDEGRTFNDIADQLERWFPND